MLRVFLGTDRKKARAALHAAIDRRAAVRITDASSLDDLRAALMTSANMFGGSRTVVFDGISANEEMRGMVISVLPAIAETTDSFFVLEEKPDAEFKKKLQKYAKKVEIFDAAKKKEYPTVFKLADYLKKVDKKKLWIAYQRELAQGEAPEAIHGVLFWGAKQALLAARDARTAERSKHLVATLAELPHESRRRGEELEYALERFILSAV